MPHGVGVPREERRVFWAGIREGLSPSEAAVGIGASDSAGRKWIINAGGVSSPCVPPAVQAVESGSGPPRSRDGAGRCSSWRSRHVPSSSERSPDRHPSPATGTRRCGGGRECGDPRKRRPLNRAFQRRRVQLMTRLSHEPGITGPLVRQLLDDRQDPVGHRNATATTALGDLNLNPFRLGTLDHQRWHRDLHNVADSRRNRRIARI